MNEYTSSVTLNYQDGEITVRIHDDHLIIEINGEERVLERAEAENLSGFLCDASEQIMYSQDEEE